MQVPKLRFKEFKLPYSKYQLSNYLIESKLRNKNLIYNKNDVLSVSGKFGVINQIELQGRSFAGEKVNNYHIVETNDIVYTKSPLKLSPYGIIKVNNGISGIVSTLYAVYHVLPNAIPKYIDFYFNYNLRLNKYLKPIVNIGAKHDMKISNEYVLTNYVSFPSLEEQTKIANFLSLIDRKIELQEKLVENLKLYKKGLLKKVFSNNLGWKSAKLGDLGNFISGIGFKEKLQGIPNGDIPFFKVSDMNLAENNIFMMKSNNYISLETCFIMKYKPISNPSIIFAKVGQAIFLERKRIVNNNFLIDNNMMAFIPNDNIVLKYLYYQLTNIKFSNYCQTGALPSYNAFDLKNIKLFIPSIGEQNRIANLFSNLDKKMDFETNRLTKLKEYKKGLLQQMFI